MNVESHNLQTSAAARAPPDGGYGWVCVLAQFLINGFTWGVAAVSKPSYTRLTGSLKRHRRLMKHRLHLQSYSVYLAHYLSHDLFPEARPLDYALLGGLNYAVALLASPLATWLVRRCRVQAPMLCGVVLLAAGFSAASFASKVWHLYLTQGIAVGAGIGLLYLPAAAVVPQWFDARRSLANGLCSAGTGFGGLVACLATAAMLEAVGLPWTLRTTAAVVFGVNLVATLLMRSRHREVQSDLRIFNLQPLASYQARLLLGWSVVAMFGYITLMFSLSDYAISIGRSGKESATVAALLNLGAAVGRPIVGHVSDRMGRVQVACLLTFGCGILIFAVWLPSTSYGALLVFAIVGGATTGIFWTVSVPESVEINSLPISGLL